MEYGSDFSIDLGNLGIVQDNIFDYLKNFNALYFDSGRSATRYLVKYLKGIKVALPDYLCESIVDCFTEADIIYYPIDESLDIDNLEIIPWESIDVFYLLPYFGSLYPGQVYDYISEKKKKYGFVIIEDTTHSIFTQRLTIGDYGICSLRKWFPIPDGGVLYSNGLLPDDEYKKFESKKSERINGMVLKSCYLKGELDNKDLFRKILVKTEEDLDIQEMIYRMSYVSESILNCLSVNEIIEKRRQNHICLKNAISDILPEIQTRKETDIPIFYVTKLNERDELRNYLIKNMIYCPVHWPLPSEWVSGEAQDLSHKLISIPIDQRYGIDEVNNTANIIRGFYNE